MFLQMITLFTVSRRANFVFYFFIKNNQEKKVEHGT